MGSWSGIEDVELSLAAFDWTATLALGEGIAEELGRVEPHRGLLGPRWTIMQVRSAQLLGTTMRESTIPPIDRSSPQRFMWTVLAQSAADPKIDRAALADELAQHGRKPASHWAGPRWPAPKRSFATSSAKPTVSVSSECSLPRPRRGSAMAGPGLQALRTRRKASSRQRALWQRGCRRTPTVGICSDSASPRRRTRSGCG